MIRLGAGRAILPWLANAFGRLLGRGRRMASGMAPLPRIRQWRADAALLKAVERDDCAALRSALARGADPNARLRDKTPALILSARCQDGAIATLLLQAGADPDGQTPFGFSAAMAACDQGMPELLAALLAAGADPNLASCIGETAAMRCSYAHCGGAAVACLRLVAAAGADLDAGRGDGWSAAMHAACFGHTAILSELHRLGADFLRSTPAGETLESAALKRRHHECAAAAASMREAQELAKSSNASGLPRKTRAARL